MQHIVLVRSVTIGRFAGEAILCSNFFCLLYCFPDVLISIRSIELLLVQAMICQ